MAQRVRLAQACELAGLAEVEQAADALFAEFGIVFPPGAVVAEVTDPSEVLVVDEPPIGFAYTGPVDQALHLHQLAVHPAHGRRGAGSALLSAVVQAAGGRAVTLTTFRDIPWNGPWYAERGFVELAPEQWGPELTRLVAGETAQGIAELGPRLVMTHP
ncbi:GNAT family N-acetyltransferase [Kutzneria albida]|uniref:N-acetyltransferase domain-containing protein n=1 Tax=Kutzneria albida DSM 43870 TaxID=1449976 RepID=W5WGL3_9PSEU|nr:GNAT family N-acetyltransferase [Kutzneria albida]AHH99997.1 hypothetical protein KALB_6638 [Kutzneria albida DSM 43870]